MLNDINTALATLIQDRGLIDPREVDVRFDAPSKEWVSSLSRPTIDLFLFEMVENTEKRDGAPQTSVSGGRAERRMPPRRIDLRYMVSVLTADVEDEHELLWRVMATLLKHQQFPADVLPDSLRSLTPPMVSRMAAQEERVSTLDIWSAFGTEPHPTIGYIVTAPMDLAIAIEAPLVLTRTARYRRLGSASDAPYDTGVHIGGTVRSRTGQPVPDVTVVPSGRSEGTVTTAEGRYMLRGLPEGQVSLTVLRDGRAAQTVEVRVPGESYDIVLDG